MWIPGIADIYEGTARAFDYVWRGKEDRELKARKREVRRACGSAFPEAWAAFVDEFVSVCHSKGHAPPRSDGKPAPAISSFRLPAAERVIAIGDLHGDLHKARQALSLAGVIDADGRWCGGRTVVVQVGDQFDRGHDEVAIMHLLERLKHEAKQAGGAVHVLTGNHEAMNVRGQFRYATEEGRFDFLRWHEWQRLGAAMKALCGCEKGACDWGKDLAELPQGRNDPERARYAAVAPGMPFTSRFLAGNPVILQVGSTVFAHGGIHPEHVDYGADRINRETNQWMLGLDKKGGKSAPMPDFLAGRDAVVWSRRFSHPEAHACDCDSLREALGKLPGAERLVVGHTIQPYGITGACENRVLRVDVGLSMGCGNHETEVLEILNDREVRRLRYGEPAEDLSKPSRPDKIDAPVEAAASDA
ncbi:unnamed protein product [Pedinophyceae sp. YPF-701]|nr:unnamed protein product [Pedinophyceae sp. YPF-701]